MLMRTDNSKQDCHDTDLSKRILHRLFDGYPVGLAVRLWDGRLMQVGEGLPAFTLSFRHPGVLRDLVLFRDPVRLAEAYFGGEVEVTGDFNAAVGLRWHLEKLRLPLIEKAWLALRAFAFIVSSPRCQAEDGAVAHRHCKNGSESIAFHYDVSNEFYRLWLDPRMVYSCAYFESPEQDLEQAQCNKLEHICRKLRLRAGETLLDIGCGWGALVCWAARHHGVSAHGITLSRNQYVHACEEIARQGLAGQVTVELRDYRDLDCAAGYDKVVSVGMFEHVGLKNLPEYFAMVNRVLKPGGLFLNHGITSDEPGWSPGVATRFINRHVFPDGELDTVSRVLCCMEEADFEIFDVEGLRPHYALTLRHWVKRLDASAEEVIRLVGKRTYRIWRLYMTGCALQFEQGSTGVYQILALRRECAMPNLPLTRRDIYQAI
ncbi:cyclopropane-fatty-acyl-phospholipid synthase [mine drainage metagenome]|uniref:Cyclopropane-fatty-acyl-phospholipid synthase n=1 Tax=mine drainage metagenome TaxID=410659 RepID=A0A1J5PVK2_9ZZZZ